MSHPSSHAHCQYDHNRQQMKLMHNFNHFDFRKHYLSTPSQSQTVKLSCVIAGVKVPALHSAVYSPLSKSCCQHSASVLCKLKSLLQACHICKPLNWPMLSLAAAKSLSPWATLTSPTSNASSPISVTRIATVVIFRGKKFSNPMIYYATASQTADNRKQ